MSTFQKLTVIVDHKDDEFLRKPLETGLAGFDGYVVVPCYGTNRSFHGCKQECLKFPRDPWATIAERIVEGVKLAAAKDPDVWVFWINIDPPVPQEVIDSWMLERR